MFDVIKHVEKNKKPRFCKFLGDKKTVRQKKKSRSSCPEVFCKKEFLNILQNSQENTCAGISF